MNRTKGPNFDIEERGDGVAIVRVWRRPDLSRDEGARCASLIAGHMRRLVKSAHCCLFDLSKATMSWGPATNTAIGEMLATWESAAKPIYVLPAGESIQRLLLRELQKSNAPCFGKIVADRWEATKLLMDRGLPRRR